jgi:uncharacterized protein (TIGR02302 family)
MPIPETKQDKADKALSRSFERRVRLSLLALAGERIWEALLWPFLTLGLFVLVSMFGLWGSLPANAHHLLLALFGFGLIASLIPLFRLKWPTRAEALRRLEQDAHVKHRPASSYEDNLAPVHSGDAATLWGLHRQRLANLVSRLKPRLPRPRADRKDPYALRAALLLLLVVALLAAGDRRWERLAVAFNPASESAGSHLRLDAWVTPPVYTGVAPVVLADGTEPAGHGAETFRALSVPERSQLIVRAHSPQGQSIALMSQHEGGPERVVSPKSQTEELIEFNLPLTSAGTVDLKLRGSTIARWRFALIEDSPPTISLSEDPTQTPRGALRLAFIAADDYGVASAEARFELADESDMPRSIDAKRTEGESDPLRNPPQMALQLPRANAKSVDSRTTQDLTAHPWAGLLTRMTLVATDQAGQEGRSRPYEFILPERTFTKPLAKAVIEQRRNLVRQPAAAGPVADALDALTIGAEQTLDDRVVYLGLRNAYWRLRTAPSHENIVSVVDQLWAIALRIEDGDLPEAERALKTAQDRLMQALENDAPEEEIERLVEELRQALSDYMQKLAEQAQEKGNLPDQDLPSGDELVSQQDLDKLLESIENLAKSGSKDLAQRMLSELNDILDQLQTGTFAEDQMQQRMSEMMGELSDMISKQQKLLDDTFLTQRQQGQNDAFDLHSQPQPGFDWGQGGMFGTPPEFGLGEQFGQQQPGQQGQQGQMGQQGQQGQQGGPGQMGQGQRGQQPGSSGFGELGQRQSELKEQLQSLLDQLRGYGAESPEGLEGAGSAMGDAQESIGEGELDRATQQQSLALERMREGAQSMSEQMSQNAQSRPGRGRAGNRDPLGRPERTHGPDLGLSVRVPDEIDVQRARELLDELRRRLSEPTRPEIELDYLERLIRPY